MLDIIVEAPNHEYVLQQVKNLEPTADKMELALQQIARVAVENLLTYLQGHIRTAQTFSSIRTRTVAKSNEMVTVAFGTQTRGLQLRILDKGRREVFPIRARRLRWVTPEGVIIFAMHSRAVVGSGIMEQSAQIGLSQSQQIIDRSLTNPSYLV